MVADDGGGRPFQRRRDGLALALHADGGVGAKGEVVVVADDLFLLAIHEPDLVAEKQMQVLDAFAGQAQSDGVELKKQVEAEGAHQSQVRILGVAELIGEGAQDGERRRLPAALFLREQLGQRLEGTADQAIGRLEIIPMGVLRKHRRQHAQDPHAAFVQRAKLHLLAGGDHFERRFHRAKVPTRVTPRIFVARGKVAAAELVEVAKQMAESLTIRDF